MGRQQGKRQVVVYLSDATYRRLKLRAAREVVSMSTLVERALQERASGAHPVRALSRVAEPELSPGDAALVAHGAPLLGRGHSELPLEEALALGLREARGRPALLRALIVVLVKNRKVRWAALRRNLRAEELPALGAVVDLAAAASGDRNLRKVADALFAELAPIPGSRPFFTEGPIARYSVALAERTPAALRRWGFVCATSLEDFKEAVRRFG